MIDININLSIILNNITQVLKLIAHLYFSLTQFHVTIVLGPLCAKFALYILCFGPTILILDLMIVVQ